MGTKELVPSTTAIGERSRGSSPAQRRPTSRGTRLCRYSRILVHRSKRAAGVHTAEYVCMDASSTLPNLTVPTHWHVAL